MFNKYREKYIDSSELDEEAYFFDETPFQLFRRGVEIAIVLGCIVYTLDISLNNRESVILSSLEGVVESFKE
tara:strand:- start:85 stop:300 length:216 start_codon:yes stop_codon:yes gene_type:complete